MRRVLKRPWFWVFMLALFIPPTLLVLFLERQGQAVQAIYDAIGLETTEADICAILGPPSVVRQGGLVDGQPLRCLGWWHTTSDGRSIWMAVDFDAQGRFYSKYLFEEPRFLLYWGNRIQDWLHRLHRDILIRQVF